MLIYACRSLQDIDATKDEEKRPSCKGADKTVIELLKKKCKEDKPLPFLKKSPKDREKGCPLNKILLLKSLY